MKKEKVIEKMNNMSNVLKITDNKNAVYLEENGEYFIAENKDLSFLYFKPNNDACYIYMCPIENIEDNIQSTLLSNEKIKLSTHIAVGTVAANAYKTKELSADLNKIKNIVKENQNDLIKKWIDYSKRNPNMEYFYV